MLRWLRSNLKLNQVLSHFRVDQPPPPTFQDRTQHSQGAATSVCYCQRELNAAAATLGDLVRL